MQHELAILIVSNLQTEKVGKTLGYKMHPKIRLETKAAYKSLIIKEQKNKDFYQYQYLNQQ